MNKFIISYDTAYLVSLPYIPEKKLLEFAEFGLYSNDGYSHIRIEDDKQGLLYIDVTLLFIKYLIFSFLP